MHQNVRKETTFGWWVRRQNVGIFSSHHLAMDLFGWDVTELLKARKTRWNLLHPRNTIEKACNPNLAIYINISPNYCSLLQITLSLNCLATEHQKNSFYPGLRIKKHHIWSNNSLTCQSINNNDSVTRAFLTMVIVISTFGRFQRYQMTP